MAVYSVASKKKLKKAARNEEPSSEESDEENSDVEVEETEENHSGGDSLTADSGLVSNTSDSAPASSSKAIEFSEPAQWVERMALTSTRPLPDDLDADDDPKREEAFIQQTLLSVHRGLALLEEAGVPCRRPADYYAEMYKSDTHMNDVRRAIEASKARLEAQAHRRSMKDQKKYGKEVQAEVMRQRAKFKRDMQDRLSEWKKKTKGNRGEISRALDDDEEGGFASRGSRKVGAKAARPRSLKPGGSKRPGKNARRRKG